jgi:hypothetical protein
MADVRPQAIQKRFLGYDHSGVREHDGLGAAPRYDTLPDFGETFKRIRGLEHVGEKVLSALAKENRRQLRAPRVSKYGKTPMLLQQPRAATGSNPVAPNESEPPRHT